jgi:hypothetical protein
VVVSATKKAAVAGLLSSVVGLGATLLGLSEGGQVGSRRAKVRLGLGVRKVLGLGLKLLIGGVGRKGLILMGNLKGRVSGNGLRWESTRIMG